MPRLYVAFPLAHEQIVLLDNKQAHYLIHVLRLKVGDEVHLFNGEHGEWRGKLHQVKRKSWHIVCGHQIKQQISPPDLHYYFAPLKQGRLDYMIQKAVEMGAGVIQPILTEFTQNHRLNVKRMQANAIEAAEQCGLLNIPKIESAISFDMLLKSWPLRSDERILIFADEKLPSASPIAALEGLSNKPVACLIGPEGGFSPKEAQQLHNLENGLGISLGPRILRADTAAVAALALIGATAGDW